MLSLNYRDARPIHEQVREGLRRLVVTGAVAEGEPLPAAEALAARFAINPTAVRRAYEAVSRRLAAMDCDPERDVSLRVVPRDAVGPVWSPKGVSVC